VGSACHTLIFGCHALKGRGLPLPRPFRACHTQPVYPTLRCDRALVGAGTGSGRLRRPKCRHLAPVQGTVYLKGQRLADANIIFTPQAARAASCLWVAPGLTVATPSRPCAGATGHAW